MKQTAEGPNSNILVMKQITIKSSLFIYVVILSTPNPLPVVGYGKDLTCHAQRRKPKRVHGNCYRSVSCHGCGNEANTITPIKKSDLAQYFSSGHKRSRDTYSTVDALKNEGYQLMLIKLIKYTVEPCVPREMYIISLFTVLLSSFLCITYYFLEIFDIDKHNQTRQNII